MKDNPRSEERGSDHKCPYCDSDVLQDAIKCKVCHHFLRTNASLKLHETIKEKKDSTVIKCPFCAEDVPGHVQICKHCLENISHRKFNLKIFKLEDHKKIETYYQPLWHLILLSIITLNFYQIYWFFRNWKFLKTHFKLRTHPLIYTLLLLIPGYNLFLVFKQINSIGLLAQEKNIQRTFYPIIVFFFWAIFLLESLASFFVSIFLHKFSFIVLITSGLGLLSIFPIAVTQDLFNEILLDEQPHLEFRNKPSIFEILVILIGIGIWTAFGMSLLNLLQFYYIP